MTTKRTLADRRAAFAPPANDNQSNNNFSNYYPFWNMKDNQRAIVRFIPDANNENPRGFLVEKATHRLHINGKDVTVQCLQNYGEECPICKASREFYKQKDEVNGKRYWRKKQYIAKCIVIEDPLPPNPETGETHQGQVRTIALGHQIYQIIQEAFASVDDPLDELPEDFDGGYDFIIKKTKQGEYSTYTTGTKFHSKQRALDADELALAEENMVDLTTLLPANPGYDKLQSMLEADMNGGDYEDGTPQYTPRPAPAGKNINEDNEEFEQARPARTSRVTDDEPRQPRKPAPVDADADEDVDEILAAIQARRNRG